MKQAVMVLTVVGVMSVSGLAFACMEGKKEGMGKGMMNKTIMVSSNGGGVIILIGNKLQKYDSKLNLVKEVEIKAEEQGCEMCAKMQGEGKKCSVCKAKGDHVTGCAMCAKMSQGKMSPCGKSKENAEAKQELENVPAENDADHKAHH